ARPNPPRLPRSAQSGRPHRLRATSARRGGYCAARHCVPRAIPPALGASTGEAAGSHSRGIVGPASEPSQPRKRTREVAATNRQL
ncbi:MAG: hypothetical protein AVDCRST_MAG59-1990, partial [uncultured Thermomicrobiales bacterium]